ncbi:MAG: hypothetical protein EOM40_03260 [Clostridia bacterium]|nr:hypothetical protein [Clostridia bacterium]NCC42992.1 hypothetical protein [Clostridia bacterium]
MEKRKCIQCGKEFILTDSEIKFYESKHLNLPKRCKACREENKHPKHETVHQKENKIENKIEYKKDYKKSIIAILVIIIAVLFGGRSVLRVITSEAENQARQQMAEFAEDSQTAQESESPSGDAVADSATYTFSNEKLLQEHFVKHGGEFGYATPQEYEAGASAVITSPNALHKTEKEDGDDVYYIEATNEFVILSTSGFIRTYFKPEDEKAYYDRQ